MPDAEKNLNRIVTGEYLSAVSLRKAVFPSLNMSVLDLGMKMEIPAFSGSREI